MKGIILAGGAGTRLQPLTLVTSKQLLPVYDRPMIYYPLETLIKGGIKNILLISDPINIKNFIKLLGSGQERGVHISYAVQDKPEGLAQALVIGENFIGQDNVTMILGDNIFLGQDDFLAEAIRSFKSGGRIFVKEVKDPARFGVATFDEQGQVTNIEEKPKNPQSSFAVTGLYIYDHSAPARARSQKPSARGELEITDLNNSFLQDQALDVKIYQGAWFDAGTFDSLLEAGNYVANLKNKL